MEKLDLTKLYKEYYTAKPKPEITQIESAQFLAIDGKGDPSGKTFADNVQALYSTAYTVKFSFKELGRDFTVPKLEGLWWIDEKKYSGISIVEAPTKIPRSEWEYRLLIRMPDYVSEQSVTQCIGQIVSKKKMTRAKKIRLIAMEEGKCVQMLHVGSFEREVDTLKLIGEFMLDQYLEKNGYHHEIYLSDFRKTPPEKLKTILREPVK